LAYKTLCHFLAHAVYLYISVCDAGVLYHRWGKLDKARQSYLIALQLDPNNAQTLDNLQLLNRRQKH